MGAPQSTAPPAEPPGLESTRFGWVDVAIAGGLALIGLGLRLYQWSHTPVMFNDGPRFLVQAQQFASGAWEAALGDPYHPLYALAIAASRLLAGMEGVGPAEWERAAVAVSIAAGTASIPVFYAFLKSAFDARTAWIGAGLLVVNPYSVEFSADVQSEGLYQFVFLLAVAFGWTAVKRGRDGLAGWAGVAAALAYLTRPEGLGVAVGVGLVGAFQLVSRKWAFARSVAWGTALAVGVVATMAPYLIWLRVDNGFWTLSQKKSVAALAGTVRDIRARPSLGTAPGAQVPFSPEVSAIRYEWRHKAALDREARGIPEPEEGQPMLSAVGKLLLTTQSALRPEIVVFALLGLVFARGRPGLRGQFMIGVLVVYALAMWGLATNYGYLSRRHVLAPATLLIGYAAFAVPISGRYLLQGLARLRGRAGTRPNPALATGLVLTLVVGIALGKLLRPNRSHNRVERDAAEWIHEHPEPGIPGGPVASGKRRVAYYAGAAWFPLRRIPDEAPLALALRLAGVRYVVADQDDVETWKDLAEPERAGLRVVYSTRAEGETATVFEVGSQEGGLMLRRYSEVFRTLLMGLDLALVAGAWCFAYYVRFYTGFTSPRGIPPFTQYALVLPFILPVWFTLLRSRGLYEPQRTDSPLREAGGVIGATAMGVVVLVALSFFVRGYYYSRIAIGVFTFASAFSIIGMRWGVRSTLRRLRRKGRNLRYVLIVGAGDLAREVIERIHAHPEAGLRVVGVLGGSGAELNRRVAGVPIIGEYGGVKELLARRRIDQVVLALPRDEQHHLEKVLGSLDDEVVNVRMVPDLLHVMTLRSSVEDLDGLPTINLRDTPLLGWAAVQKRMMDLALTVPVLLVLSPLLASVALAVGLTSGWPVFYRQKRMGLDGRVFKMIKFRTMRRDAEADTGPVWTSENDPRRTRLGSFLRATNIDELPQIWNVVRGDMSLVGPRPERPVFIERFRREIPGYMLRHKVKAGLTGWAQVHGWRGDTSLHERIEHDIYYIQNWSLGLDIRILLMTVWRGFRNAY